MEAIQKSRQITSTAGALLLVTLMLTTVGLVMVYSASAPRAGYYVRRQMLKTNPQALEDYGTYHDGRYFVKQLGWVLIGLAGLWVLYKMDYGRLGGLSLVLFVITLGMLLLVLLTPLGVTVNGARRWLRIGPITLQPSEFAKLALVIISARYLSGKRGEIRNFWSGVTPIMAVAGGYLALIFLEKDLGTIIVIGAVLFVMFAISQMRRIHLFMVSISGLFVVGAGLLSEPYRRNRILSFLFPERFEESYGYQLKHSLIAFGSGGWTGTGLGEGVQKYQFLSEAHTDFIYAVIGEELGFIGASLVPLMFIIFIWMGMRVALKSSDYFGSLLAAGLTTLIGLSAFVNFAVTLGLAPTKGLALPFISAGGSSLISSLAAVGILMNISDFQQQMHGESLRPVG
ncbi:MAG: putative lipid II flippase FtsW [Candidatus Sumerlaeia bacterium]